MSIKPLSFGEMRITALVTSRFKLDGGSMFGVIPRPLWEKKCPADDRNRIDLSVNTLLLETGEETVLVEPGMGSKYGSKLRDIYDLEPLECVDILRRLGCSPDGVDVVVPTHLHLDHAGASTVHDDSGRAVPAFPGARYVVQEEELRAATSPHPLERPSYVDEDFIPILASGQMETVRGTCEVAEGVFVEFSGGHTRGHQVVRLRCGGEEALYIGDLVPTTAHLKLNWLMAWDMYPQVVYAEKERLLREAAERQMLVFFPHDPEIAAGRIERSSSDSFRVVEDSVLIAEQIEVSP